MNFSRFESLFKGHVRHYRGDTLREHGFAGTGRADEQNIVPARGGNLKRALDIFLPFDLREELRPVYGALPMAIAAARCGVKKLFVPADNAAEAAFADGISVYPVKNVDELLRLMRGEVNIEPAAAPALDTLMEHMPADRTAYRPFSYPPARDSRSCG